MAGSLLLLMVRVAAALDDRLPKARVVYPTEVNGFLDNSDKIGPNRRILLRVAVR
jgi:hypothetical protein